MTDQDQQQQKPVDGSTAEHDHDNLGFAGRTARAFIDSPLSPLLFVAMLFMGMIGLVFTPRQEDPQISVPMVDIFVQYAGASAEQVASLAIDPLERIMSEIPGTKHVYSAAQRGQGMVTVEFEVGEEMEPSLVKLYDKLQSNMDKIPPGVSQPLVKPKGIDDVPVITLTLWSDSVEDDQLRKLALDVLQSIKEVPDTGQGFVVGGRHEQVRVEVFPERLSGFDISLDQVANTIQTANSEKSVGGVESGDTHFSVVTGSFLRTAEDIKRLVVGSHNGVPVYVRDVARVALAPAEASSLVAYYTGEANDVEPAATALPAVTIAVAKKVGTNGVVVANAVLDKVEDLKNYLIPGNVNVSVTRNYGQTANDKVNSLILKLFYATGFVFVLVFFAFVSLRPAIVVLLVIPVVILFTVFVAFLMGYTVDRVSLFALIFSIGILVDDAIVVVENIYRRWLAKGDTNIPTAVDAVREVGNPTILATFTVIAALLPMGFVRGMMGPYMEPIPALGSVAMLISLFAAFVFTPWMAYRLKPGMNYLHKAERREHRESEWLGRMYSRILNPLIDRRGVRLVFRLGLWGLFFAACAMFYTTAVTVKMLPLDNKPEFSVVINMPEGTALPVTANLTHQMAESIREMDEVTAMQTYVGTARPFDFNGMVRHYYLRDKPWQAEVQVQLLDKNERELSSHELALQARELVTPLAMAAGARVAVVEMPPGPPVLQTVVAEVYGPDANTRRQVAADLVRMFEAAPNVTDVDSFLEQPYEYWRFEVDREKAVRNGVTVDTINRNLAMAVGDFSLGDVKYGAVLEPTHIVIQVPLPIRSQITRLNDLPMQSDRGHTVPLGELGRFVREREDPVVFHKDLRPIELVTGDVTGRLAAPVYGMMQIEEQIAQYTTPDGGTMKTDWFANPWFGPPANDKQSGFEWTGEWTVTLETFRDMGMAFMAALVLIYILVVWEFGNFRIPALIMAPIPLTLLGIIPGHWLFGAEFTATSMIGWIALAGIIVRNSILLVDFSIHSIGAGATVREAVIDACKTRTRPILITAFALMAGSSVILPDPIFNGMAISLFFGVFVSTILTLVVIPLGCLQARDSLCELVEHKYGISCPPDETSADDAPTDTPRTSRAIAVWGKLVDVLTMAFYIVRAVFILAWEGLKSLARLLTGFLRKPGPPDGGGSAAPPAGGAPPVPASPAADSVPASGAAPSAPASPAADSAVTESAPRTPSAPVRKTVPRKAPAKRKSTVKKATPRKKTVAKGSLQEAPAQAQVTESVTETKSVEIVDSQPAPRDKGAARVRRGGRRGIRLKSDDSQARDEPDSA
jgi:multidrug efflux pump subunit AcrB